MKYRSLFLALLAFVFATGLAHAAEELLKVAPQCCKVILENEEVRVLDYVGKAGEKIGLHMHPNHVIYALSDGKVRFTMEDGSSKESELKNGQAIFVKAVTHSTENISPDDIHIIVVEMKKPKATRSSRSWSDDEAEGVTYKVVGNHEGQLSMWPGDRQNAAGWDDMGFSGTKQECLDYIRRQ